MENLQSEVIELEFLEFSRGLATISEEDFARILLRYTMLDSSDIEECIKRVQSRTPSEKVRPSYTNTADFQKIGTLNVQSTVIVQELFPFTNYPVDAMLAWLKTKLRNKYWHDIYKFLWFYFIQSLLFFKICMYYILKDWTTLYWLKNL